MNFKDERNALTLPSQEIAERSFTIVKSGLPPALLEQLAIASRALRILPIVSDFERYHAYDLVDPLFRCASNLPLPLIDVEQAGSYLAIQLHSEFIRALQPEKKTNRPTANLDNIRSNPFRALITSPGAKGDLAESEIENNIWTIENSMKEFRHLAILFEKLRLELGLKSKKLDPSIYILSAYVGNGTVFNEDADFPGHRDEAVTEKEVLVSIQLTEGTAHWIIGRDENSLECVQQEMGDMVILDNYGELNVGDKRRNPIHHVTAGPTGRRGLLLSFTESQHQRFLDFLDDFALTNAWQPTDLSSRQPFTPMRTSGSKNFGLARELLL